MGISVHIPDDAEALHFEKWLDEKESLPGFWSRMLHQSPSSGSFDVFKSPSEAYEADMANLDAEDAALRAEAEKITASEAAWVIAHLTRSGDLTSAEKRLLQFLGAEAASIPPVLRTLVDQANRGQSRAASG